MKIAIFAGVNFGLLLVLAIRGAQLNPHQGVWLIVVALASVVFGMILSLLMDMWRMGR